MNSWRSTLLSACAPPFSTFIIGAGSRCAVGAAEPAVERAGRRRRRRRGRRRARRRAARSRRAATWSRCRRARSSFCVERALLREPAERELCDRVRNLAVHVRDGARDALSAVAARVFVAQLERLARAGGGAGRHRRAARAGRRVVVTSTARVGLPRESRISSARTLLDARPAMATSLAGGAQA